MKYVIKKKYELENKRKEIDYEINSETEQSRSQVKNFCDSLVGKEYYEYSLNGYNKNSNFFIFKDGYDKAFCNREVFHIIYGNRGYSYSPKEILIDVKSNFKKNINTSLSNFNNNDRLFLAECDSISEIPSHSINTYVFNISPLVVNSHFCKSNEDFLLQSKCRKTLIKEIDNLLALEKKISISGKKPEWLENYQLLK